MTVLYDQRVRRGDGVKFPLFCFFFKLLEKFAGKRGDGSAEGGQVTQGSSAVERKRA